MASVYSVQANMIDVKARIDVLMHEIDALALNFNHTAVYAHIVIACDGPKIRMCAKSDNTAMTTDLMVI